MTKTVTISPSPRPNRSHPLGSPINGRNTHSGIQWPSTEELNRVSASLSRISKIGISSEVNGDYFTSGDLAYQLHEILRATRELLRKSLRGEGE